MLPHAPNLAHVEAVERREARRPRQPQPEAQPPGVADAVSTAHRRRKRESGGRVSQTARKLGGGSDACTFVSQARACMSESRTRAHV
jgi:hypothetical protein